MNTLFKDLELKKKNSKYYKDKIAPNLINRQNWCELCIWNNERSRFKSWLGLTSKYTQETSTINWFFFSKKIPNFYLFVFHYLFYCILINLLFICCILEEPPGNHFLVNWSYK